MYINGRYRLACQTNVLHLHTDEVHIEPLPHLPLVKDLVCDMDDFFAKYEYIQPWLIRHSQEPAKEILQSPADRHKLNMPIDCILCGACYSSCPSVWGEDNYLGPAALLKAYRFEVDSRDEASKERLPQLGQRARRLPLPHHHQLHRGVPEGAESDGGHPVAQDGGRAPEAVRQGQVTRLGRATPRPRTTSTAEGRAAGSAARPSRIGQPKPARHPRLRAAPSGREVLRTLEGGEPM